MKKKPYDVYSPKIYPRLLFVSTNIEDLDKYFIFLDIYMVTTMEANIINYYKKQINMMVEWLLVK